MLGVMMDSNATACGITDVMAKTLPFQQPPIFAQDHQGDKTDCFSGQVPEKPISDAPISDEFPAPEDLLPEALISTPKKPSRKSNMAQISENHGLEPLDAKSPWAVEVKNTFIHCPSPLPTVSLVTPPKTVPRDFAPEYVLLHKPCTPAAFANNATPSTAGGFAKTGPAFCQNTISPAARPPQAGTLLRLSDFLASPQAGMQPLQEAGQVQGDTSYASWHTSETAQNIMPPVPPLPGPLMTCGSSSLGAYDPQQQSVYQQHMTMGTAPSFQEDSMMAGSACGFGDAMQFDTSAFQYLATDSQSYMQGGTMPYLPTAMPPQLPGALIQDALQPPPLPPPTAPYEFHCASTQPAGNVYCASTQPTGNICDGMMCYSQCAPEQFSVQPASCSQVPDSCDHQVVPRVSISVGHFPEPSAAAMAQIMQQPQLDQLETEGQHSQQQVVQQPVSQQMQHQIWQDLSVQQQLQPPPQQQLQPPQQQQQQQLQLQLQLQHQVQFQQPQYDQEQVHGAGHGNEQGQGQVPLQVQAEVQAPPEPEEEQEQQQEVTVEAENEQEEVRETSRSGRRSRRRHSDTAVASSRRSWQRKPRGSHAS